MNKKEYMKQWRLENKEHIKEYSKKYKENNFEDIQAYNKSIGNKYKDNDEYRRKQREYAKQYRSENVTERKARSALNYSLEKGEVTKKECAICGDVKSEGHHYSYREENWLSVIWLCRKHHTGVNGIHRKPELYKHLIPEEN